MHSLRYTLPLLLLSALFLCACEPRESALAGAPKLLAFSEPKIVTLPTKIKNSSDKLFADVDCDSIPDLIDFTDSNWVYEGSQAQVYLGTKNDSGLLEFSENSSFKIDIPLGSSLVTPVELIKSADINGDGCDDFVTANYSHATFKLLVALNQGEGRKFIQASKFNKGASPLDENLLALVKTLADKNSIANENITDLIRVDWADANGDGRDDLHIFSYASQSLDLAILYSGDLAKSRTSFYLHRAKRTEVRAFLSYNRFTYLPIKTLQTTDLNGDRLSDLVLYIKVGNNLTLFAAYNVKNEEVLRYQALATIHSDDINTKYLDFQTIDFVDVNFDGCADYAHLGVINQLTINNKIEKNVKVGSYKIANCEKL